MGKDDILREYIQNSYLLLQGYVKGGRYFHKLTPLDNSPTVVHKQTNQLTYVIEGEGVVTLNGKSEKIKKDSAVFIEAGTTHRFNAVSDNLILFHIHVPDEGREKDRYIIEGDDYNRYV
nr:cupin domain-containing protein [uncultured Blautia sp.]